MLRSSKYCFFVFGFMAIILLVNGCENDYPDSLWDPNYKTKPDPQISNVEPEQNAFAGIDEITIIGQNFASVMDENQVYFDGILAQILSSSATELIVKAPNVVSDSILVQVSVQGAVLFGEYFPYPLLSALYIVGDFDKNDDAYAIEYNPADSSLYVSLLQDNKGGKNKIVRISPDNERHDYSKSLLDKASGMKFSPDGSIFYANAINVLCRIPPGGENPATAGQIHSILTDAVYDLDLDENSNIFAAGSGSVIYRIKSDDGSNVLTAATYESVNFKAVRVYDGYVYVAGKYSGTDPMIPAQAIWRNQITSADGDLGLNELYYDWATGPYSTSTITTLTFSSDGDAYIGSTGKEVIVILEPDGTIEPLYPGVLLPESYYLTWGDGIFLYANRRSSVPEDKAILMINVLEEGAPYYGRQ
jgi:hypothetical protein